MNWPTPSPGQQVEFLRNLQRLLAEGLFVASYKFALIHALADLAVLRGDDTGAPLDLDTKDIAERFVELYWRQARPFRAGLILQQNTGRQAAVISEIAKSHQECGGSLFRFRQSAPRRWSTLVSEVDRVVRVMPLWKLQTVGDERLNFLYENRDGGNQIALKPGIGYCFRAFYELVRDLIEGAWARFVQQVNVAKLGDHTDLGAFLFGQERANLEAYRPILRDVQKNICLYCGGTLPKQAQVDHFIPWSRYPADLGHNFVLAHVRCNQAKSDHLAAEVHLATWVGRNENHKAELETRLAETGLPGDWNAAVQVARWLYGQTETANGQVWVVDKTLKHLGRDWARCFAA
jgi:5-methylcytosine-specific restriction endonuclease McrA